MIAMLTRLRCDGFSVSTLLLKGGPTGAPATDS